MIGRTLKFSEIALMIGLTCTTGIIAALAVAYPFQPQRNLIAADIKPENAISELQGLSDDQRQMLLRRETLRMQAEPLDNSALVNIAVLKSLAGDRAGSLPFALEAADRSLRDSRAQVNALSSYLESKDSQKAFFHIDGLLTSQPQLDQAVYPSILNMLRDPVATINLAAVLVRNPLWRNSFLIWLAKNDPDGQATFQLFSAIRKAGGSVKTGELKAYLAQLVSKAKYESAYFIWLDSLDEQSLLKVSNIFDGQFALSPTNLYFDWNLEAFPNSQVAIVESVGAAKRRFLQLSFYNSTQPYGHVYQYLRLAPGNYAMTGEWAATNYSSTGGLMWRMTCVESNVRNGQSGAFKQSAAWTSFTASFDVPTEGCQTQMLRLQSASEAILDAKMDGEIRFTNLKMEIAKAPGE